MTAQFTVSFPFLHTLLFILFHVKTPVSAQAGSCPLTLNKEQMKQNAAFKVWKFFIANGGELPLFRTGTVCYPFVET
jgi:hypothetical protein